MARRTPPPRLLSSRAFSQLDEAAIVVRGFTYGQHNEFCRVTGADPQKLWRWAQGRLEGV